VEAVLEPGHVEVDQVSLFDSRQLEVGQQLSLVNGPELLYALEFQDDLVFDKKVQSIATIQVNALVIDRQGVFDFELDVVEIQFMGQALLIRRFE